MVLLIVVDHEQSENEQAGEKSADDLARQMKIPERSDNRTGEQHNCGKNAPPTPGCRIGSERFGGQDQFFAGSHVLRAQASAKIVPLSINDFENRC